MALSTVSKMAQVEVRVAGKIDGTVHDKAWTMLRLGASVATLVALIDAGTLVTTPWEFIPLNDFRLV